MNIRPAQPGDLPALLEIFAHARAFMAQTGNSTQWPATYPGAELMQQQIARGVCYVLEGNARLEATFCYIPGPEPTYAEIYDGGWPDDAPYATIHRMASAGRVHGAAAICFAWCAARGLPLRADTHADNKVMQHLLEKNGFVRCGNITLADGTSRIAYHCTVPPRGGKQQTAAQAAAALAQAAKALPKPADGPLLVALDGRCAAGKTTIAAQMARQYGWGVVHLDDFFLQPIQRTPQRMAEPGGNLDRERLIAEVLEPLRAGQQGSYRLFDCRTMALVPGTVPLPQTPIILLEGSYSCHPDLWNYCALHAFVNVEPAEQLRRLAARAPEKLEDFKTRWIPKEETYFAHFRIPERCEVKV